MMGGGIFVDSELGHGALFTIRVPAILDAAADRAACDQGAERADRRAGVNSGRGHSMSSFAHTASATSGTTSQERAFPAAKLLIVDNPADNRTTLSRRFAEGGFEIVEVDNGTEALRLVQGRSFDVMLLDMMLPDMSGTEVLRRIREKFSASLLPVIMMTANSQAEDIIEAMKIGANDYVRKPIDFSIALARASNQVARRRAELELRDVNATAGPDEREHPAVKLLIVDDIADNRAVLSRKFVRRGIRDRRSRLRRGGAEARSRADIRRGAPRRDDAGHGRQGRPAPASRDIFGLGLADHHGDCQGPAGRRCRSLEDRRQRLRDEARRPFHRSGAGKQSSGAPSG